MRTGNSNRRAGGAAFGFSLVELLVSLGVLLLLLGLLMPALAGARTRAAQIGETAVIRSAATLVAAYCNEWRENFPIASERVGGAMLSWHRALAPDVGETEASSAVDPGGVRRFGRQRFALSGALTIGPETMIPGQTVPIDIAFCSPVRASQVRYPSTKGLLVQWVHPQPGGDRFWTYTRIDPPLSPVAMCDGAAMSARCTDFHISPAHFENWVGHPVLSTWQGCYGRDEIRPPSAHVEDTQGDRR